MVTTTQHPAPLKPPARSLPCQPVLGASGRVQQLFPRPLWCPSKTCVRGRAVRRLSWTLLQGAPGLLRHRAASAPEPSLPTALSRCLRQTRPSLGEWAVGRRVCCRPEVARYGGVFLSGVERQFLIGRSSAVTWGLGPGAESVGRGASPRGPSGAPLPVQGPTSVWKQVLTSPERSPGPRVW